MLGDEAEAKVVKPVAIPDTLDRVVDLQEVVVKPKREKYSKKNNPAVDFVNSIRRSADIGDPLKEPYYGYKKYERITLALNDVSDSIGRSGLLKQFAFLNEYVDTSAVTGKTILPISVKEKISDVVNRANPKSRRELVTAIRREGLDDFVNQDNIQLFLEELVREINLYDNDITLLGARFVSPLSKIGPDFYKYYLADTVATPTDTSIVLTFAPRNSAMMGFTGRLFVAKGDSSMFIRRAILNIPHSANVNFVESMRIEQTFEKDSLGNRRLTSDDLVAVFSVISGTQGMYIQKHSLFTDHSYEEPDKSFLFDRMAEISERADAYLQPEEVWLPFDDGTRRHGERKIAELVENMRSVPLYYWTEKVLKVLVTGYFPLGRRDKVELGPVNTLLSFNDVEGMRLRVGGITTANLNKRWFARAYGAYGFKDRRFKYRGEVEYSFRDKKRHSREFPMHGIRLSHKYDMDALGQHYLFAMPDNIFLSLKRLPDTLQLYRRDTRLEYNLELENHFSTNVTLETSRLEPSRYIGFRMADGSRLPHLVFNTASVTLRYAPGEKFMQTKSDRLPVNYDAPVFMLTHTFGPANTLGSSRYTINKTEALIQNRFWFSAFGYADVILKGGHVWSTTPFTQLLIPNANLSYTIQPESFALMSAMEFVLDSYASIDFTYWGNGVVLNYMPLMKKLKWREVVAFRSLWGHLSDKNNPSKNHWLPQFPGGASPVEMTSKPYMEISVGLDNIFKILRLDYVWRLSYRNTPGVDKAGLRVALHFSF